MPLPEELKVTVPLARLAVQEKLAPIGVEDKVSLVDAPEQTDFATTGTATGTGLNVKVTELLVTGHNPAGVVIVSVNVPALISVEVGTYVAFSVDGFGVNVPDPPDQVPLAPDAFKGTAVIFAQYDAFEPALITGAAL